MKLIINNIDKNFNQKIVLDKVSFEFENGKIYSLLGRNGAGKTTFFNCLCGNLETDGGNFFIEEGGKQKNIEYDDIGMVSASPTLPEFLTGYEFVKFFMQLKDIIPDEAAINNYFEIIRMNEQDRHTLIKEYSFGMKNKIQLLTCLIAKPKIILLDEPLTSFDIIVSHDIKELLISMKSEHIIIMSTHILQLAQDVSDEIVVLSNGKILTTDSDTLNSEDFENKIVEILKDSH